MYFDPHTHPDWWKRAFVLKAAIDEVGFPSQQTMKSWARRAALAAFSGIIILALLARAFPMSLRGGG